MLGTYVTSHDMVSGILRLSKMAQNSYGTTYSYRADDDATIPFADDKPSGSDWGENQLKWFGIDIKRDCSLQEIAPGDIKLMPAAKTLTHIHKNLDKDWEDIEALGVYVDRETFYGALLNLLDPQEPIPSYATSLATGSSPATGFQGLSPVPVTRPMARMPTTPIGPAGTTRAPTGTNQIPCDSWGAPVAPGTPSPSSSWSSWEPPSPSPNPLDLHNLDDNSSEANDQLAAVPSRQAFETFSVERIRKLEIDVEMTAGAFLTVINDGLVAGAKGAIERTFTR